MAEDWCAAAARRVEKGSDGVWIRFGPKVDDSLMSKFFSIRFNPITSGAATVMLFGFVIVLLAIGVDREGCLTQLPVGDDTQFKSSACYTPQIEFSFWMKWVADCFTWLYIGSQDCWVVFLVVLYFSRFADMKLGKDDDVPEFSDFAWFSMVFSCGVGVGLFFYGVAEPIWHYVDVNRYGHQWNGTKRLPDNERAQAAMNLTWFHWGLHGWVVYAVVGVLLAFLHFRKGLPMTIKTCFYPLIGERIYGFWGDFVDSISIVATTMGVCTSLGLGVFQINAGIRKLTGYPNWIKLSYYNEANFGEWSDRVDSLEQYYLDYPVDSAFRSANPFRTEDGSIHIGTASRIASFVDTNDEQILIIWLITLVATVSVASGLQVGIQSLSMICLYLGMFLMMVILLMDDTWYIMNLYTQSLGYYLWDFLRISFYSAAFAQSDHAASEGEASWYMSGWTIFYWGWWIAFAPFVGIFFARISKGRTIRQFLNGTMTLPIAYNFAWMAIFGGAGLKMEMAADKFGVTCATPRMRANICRVVERMRPSGYGGNPEVYCSTITKLSCRGTTDMVFDVLSQYADVGALLAVVCLISLILYFITSSDSGSLVDDIVSANGIEEPPVVQRVYWAFTEGAAATALLYQGRLNYDAPDAGLQALQSASICVGLPYTFLICFMCVSLWRALQYERGELKWGESQFKHSVLDVGVTAYGAGEGTTRFFNLKGGSLDGARFGKFFFYIAAPILPFYNVTRTMKSMGAAKSQGMFGPMFWACATTAFAAAMFYLWFILVLVDHVDTAVDAANVYGNVIPGGIWTGRGWTPDEYTQYKVTQRFGMYKRYPTDVMEGTNKTALDAFVTSDGAQFFPEYLQAGSEYSDNGVAVGAVGDRLGAPLHYAVIGWYFYLTFACLLMSLRNQVRTAYGLAGNIVEDFFAALFVYPTVLMQLEEMVGEPPTEKPTASKCVVEEAVGPSETHDA